MEEKTIKISRLFEAPIALVWRAITEKELMKEWYRTQIKDFGDPYTNHCTTTLQQRFTCLLSLTCFIRWMPLHCRKSQKKDKYLYEFLRLNLIRTSDTMNV